MIGGILAIKKLYKRRLFRVLSLVLIILFIGILWQHTMSYCEEDEYNPPGAGEKPPYILVGHSLSSLEVIHYA